MQNEPLFSISLRVNPGFRPGLLSAVAFGDWNHLEPMVHATP
jgi:hypothetical protein